MPPGSARAFQPRRDVHAVAVDVVALDDDVAEVDTDAKANALVLGNARLAPGHGALDLDGALHGVDHARELHQRAVAHQLDDASVVRRDRRIDELPGEGL